MDTHIQHQVEDYVLGLLSPQDRGRVEQHTAQCATCRQALQQERQLAQMVGHTLHEAAVPPARQLRRLRPRPPRASLWRLWPQPLASLALVVMLFVLGLGWQMNNQAAILTQPTPTYLAITATHTQTHTDTPAATAVSQPPTDPKPAAQTIIPHTIVPAGQPPISRAPIATPVAVLAPTNYTSN